MKVGKLILKVLPICCHANLLMVVCVHRTMIAFPAVVGVLNVVASKANQKDAQVVVRTVVVARAMLVITM